ncbi:thiamine-phosphate kinase [Microbacterium sp. LRZ72]|uniref:thiamine-phosphate kinase n=1 Tax=Microbacterium sp. LRZ72 TaxID=2942481 RepID=UPI0029AF9620|nr:thiamine-phosphate kinase [Microbacterium sp. LRZ72]MDX2375603.1 thiamine-phosphate kinase [Microbacterium sp. LRZ72]
MHPAPQPPTTVGELSEGEILERILTRLHPSEPRAEYSADEVGPGDDAAVIDVPGAVVATTDTLVHGPDFRLAWSSGFDLGWKAAAVNLADVAAMGARPTALLVALAMPDDTRVAFVEELADGLRAACEHLSPGCRVVGGDLTVSATLTIAVTALGSLEGRRPVRRSGARPGDVLALAGAAGQAARGLEVLFDRFSDAEGATPIDMGLLDAVDAGAVRAQLRPVPPIGRGSAAADAGATAMMDVSDGLAIDAGRLAAASGVRLEIAGDALGEHRRWAITGGEDHGLLATFPAGAELPGGFRIIGTVHARDGGAAVRVDGEAVKGGWDPYRDWDGRTGAIG